MLPVKIRTDKGWRAYPLTDPKVQMMPSSHRSMRNIAESFRWIVKHIQTFSGTKFVPAYKKIGSKSLISLGFSTDHEGGVACHPALPNGLATYRYVHDFLLAIPCNPPFHTNVPIPALDSYMQDPRHGRKPIMKNSKFQIRVRNAMRTKKI